MSIEDYQRLVSRMNEVQPADEAAIVVVLRQDKEIIMSTHGEARPLNALKGLIWENCGGCEK